MRRAAQCTVAALAGVVVYARALINSDHMLSSKRIAQVNIATVQTLGILAWPFVWDGLIGVSVLTETPAAAVGLAWPAALLGMDLLWIAHQTIEHEGVSKKTVFHFDSSTITTLAFAVAGVLATNVGAKFARSMAPTFSACVLICVMLLLPTPGLQANTAVAVTVQAVQKVLLTFCIGLIVTSLVISVSFTLTLREMPAICLAHAKAAPPGPAAASSNDAPPLVKPGAAPPAGRLG
jgi:hypothetical protein